MPIRPGFGSNGALRAHGHGSHVPGGLQLCEQALTAGLHASLDRGSEAAHDVGLAYAISGSGY